MTYSATIPDLGPETHNFDYVYPVEPDPDGGWRVRGGAGGSGRAPRRSTPWANLGGGGWPDQFFAGGRIDDAGIAIARIELRFANGVTLHDNADQGVALFKQRARPTGNLARKQRHPIHDTGRMNPTLSGRFPPAPNLKSRTEAEFTSPTLTVPVLRPDRFGGRPGS